MPDYIPNCIENRPDDTNKYGTGTDSVDVYDNAIVVNTDPSVAVPASGMVCELYLTRAKARIIGTVA